MVDEKFYNELTYFTLSLIFLNMVFFTLSKDINKIIIKDGDSDDLNKNLPFNPSVPIKKRFLGWKYIRFSYF